MSRPGLHRFFSSISVRLMAFNLLLVFLPAAGVLLLDTYEQHLLEGQERTMAQEGRILAAALEATGRLEASDARSILLHLGQRHLSRLRVVDADRRVLADSSALGPRTGPNDTRIASNPESDRERPLYRLFSAPVRLLRRLTTSSRTGAANETASDGLPRSVIDTALTGRYGATTRIRRSGNRNIVELHIAIPIRTDRGIPGAVLVSQSTRRVLNTLYAVRLEIARVVLISLLVAGVLSLVLGLTIARPLTRLRRRSEEILDRRGRLTGTFDAGDRPDEIGDLERALAELTRRLENHLTATENLASDLAHEFRNPLASIRATTEVALDETDPEKRQRMLETIQGDVARLERLLSGAREISRIEMLIDREDREAVPLGELLEGVCEAFRRRHDGRGPRITLDLPAEEIRVRASADRLLEVIENLLANAVDFTPSNREIRVALRAVDHHAEISVRDHGPGIPPEHLERIFSRFFSYRPDTDPGRGHMGLGLAIARTIVEAFGGAITVSNAPGGGALFVVRLPVDLQLEDPSPRRRSTPVNRPERA